MATMAGLQPPCVYSSRNSHGNCCPTALADIPHPVCLPWCPTLPRGFFYTRRLWHLLPTTGPSLAYILVSHYCKNHWLLMNLSSPMRFLLFRKCPWHRVTSRTADHASMGAAHLIFLVFMIVYLCIHSCTMHGSDIGRPR